MTDPSFNQNIEIKSNISSSLESFIEANNVTLYRLSLKAMLMNASDTKNVPVLACVTEARIELHKVKYFFAIRQD